MKKVEIKNKSFKVIPEARIVQGKMVEKDVQHDLKRGIKQIHKSIINDLSLDLNPQKVFWPTIKRLICATAYCDENDEFDEKTGIEVCSAKMELKNHKKLAKQYDKMHRILLEAANIV